MSVSIRTASTDIDIQWDVRIPLRDGIQLHARIYINSGERRPSFCIVALTPYTCDLLHERARYFASRGLCFVAVDVRGRGESQGEFRPNIQEAADGYDVIEWVAQQPYCNGQVAMWGSSYLGYAQWAVAKMLPPHLTTIVPTASPFIGVDFPMRNNMFYPYALQWLALVFGRSAQMKAFADEAFWRAKFRAWYESGRAFCKLDDSVGFPSLIFREWLAHPCLDAYWDAYNPTLSEFASITIPILTITGMYDDDQLGALEHYKRHVANASPEARARHYLIIGPWDHYGTVLPRAEFGGLKCGLESLIDLQELHIQWYAWTMGGGAKPEFLKDQVAYYVTGAERWRYSNSLADITATYTAAFLDSARNATGEESCGNLQSHPGCGPPDTYVYDPREVGGPEVDAEASADASSLTDQRPLQALGDRVLFYQTQPFDADTEVCGLFELVLWIAIDCPDTDLFASVYELGVDGQSLLLCRDALRARYRTSLRAPQLICSTDPVEYRFESFAFVAREIKRGCRLRLAISSMGRICGTNFSEKNYNAGGVVSEETAAEARPVTITLFHDPRHQSALHIPLGRIDT